MKRTSLLASVAAAVGLWAVPALAETVAATIAADPDLSTLQSAIVAAGLEGDLAGASLVTVFAPNNAAFEALPSGVFEELKADPAKLKDVLLYHVVDGAISSDQLSGALVTMTALNGKPLKDVLKDGAVVVADKRATNGIVHVINEVLLARE